MKNIIQQSFQREGFSLNEQQIEQFVQYYDLLIDWNKKINLTAIEEPQEVADKHFVDSALLLSVKKDLAGCSLIDIGTGAGFPGIPLKIIEPNLKLTLFDSLNKRINFLNTVCQELSLKDVQAVHGRAEDFGKKVEYREKFDLATARAVARMPVLLEICLPFVKLGGHFIALKGPELENELLESKKALAELGGRIIDVRSLTLADGNYTRNIAVIEKVKPTPKKYPRKAGTPQKTPLV
ncbi:MAG: 16S rRNA (guanine(527)-N(7))-methyltransferase RsmG [Cyanobacteria bacterium SIG29]|nr:16S rRNA (guanine(527)-N(7))-methyltransferase RsmG [Cyanobacteria bacterium SIG29]